MISLLDILLLCRLVFRQVPQQTLAAAQNVTVRPVKVIRIPRIFNVALPLGKVQQQMQLRLLLLRTQSTQLLQVPPLHADNQIRRFKILRRNLPRTMLRAGHPVLDQNSARGRPISSLLSAAESTSNSPDTCRCCAKYRNTIAAIGLRQILP